MRGSSKRIGTKEREKEKNVTAESIDFGPDEVLNSTQRFRQTKQTYEPMSAARRGAKVHEGPLKLTPAREPPDRTEWVRHDKKNNPYSYFESSNNVATPMPPKPPAPPKLWLPMSAEEAKRLRPKASAQDQDKEDSGAGGATSSMAKPGTLTQERTPWDTEHHIMVSKANHEVQVFTREYFDKPKRKEGEGIPKVLQLYSMNDRQCGWHDEPDKLGEPRRTYLNWVGAYNVGGPKEQQMPSYWRNVIGKHAKDPERLSHTPAYFGDDHKTPQEQQFLERLAQMPARESSAFWRGFVGQSEDARRQGEEESKSRRSDRDKKDRRSSTASVAGRAMQADKTVWDDRWSVLHSKDNQNMPQYIQEYFMPARFLSGGDKGDPRKYLASSGMKWRSLSASATSPDLRKMKMTSLTYGVQPKYGGTQESDAKEAKEAKEENKRVMTALRAAAPSIKGTIVSEP